MRQQRAIESHGEEQQSGGQLRQDQQNGGVGFRVGIDGGGVSESGLRADGLRGKHDRFDEERHRQAGGQADGGFREHPTRHLHHAVRRRIDAPASANTSAKVRIIASAILAASGPAFNPGSGRNTKTPAMRASTSRNP